MFYRIRVFIVGILSFVFASAIFATRGGSEIDSSEFVRLLSVNDVYNYSLVVYENQGPHHLTYYTAKIFLNSEIISEFSECTGGHLPTLDMNAHYQFNCNKEGESLWVSGFFTRLNNFSGIWKKQDRNDIYFMSFHVER